MIILEGYVQRLSAQYSQCYFDLKAYRDFFQHLCSRDYLFGQKMRLQFSGLNPPPLVEISSYALHHLHSRNSSSMEFFCIYSPCTPVSYTHLTLPTIYSV
eukprot:TRINITY_DN11129_c0_g1_i1.p1 TRINITY_DN11129_c0_g1~~TRINITY_DN11129_c0_g1_i1.p1  ORF type:complete len:100 (+),score=3.41 TRINITY_DN11129_c0_g1_i1:358-657(+)